VAAKPSVEQAVRDIRRALAEGIDRVALEHVMALSIPMIGLPAAVRAMTWIDVLTRPDEAHRLE
jgi:hypothetical protein